MHLQALLFGPMGAVSKSFPLIYFKVYTFSPSLSFSLPPPSFFSLPFRLRIIVAV